jgi:DedD protein
MDRRVKERLVGATILLMLVVLIVPELLSGPKRFAAPPAAQIVAPVHTVTVDLTEHVPIPAVAETASAPASASASAPASSSAIESKSPAPAQAEAAPAATGGAWAVQLGSFAAKANAEKLIRTLRDEGYTVYVLSSGAGSAARYRVRLGPLADRDAAERAVAKLKSQGHTASIVSPAA